ncbi:MAG: hypothetical protein WA208_06380 [Thermoanaerobaculia bacterium]
MDDLRVPTVPLVAEIRYFDERPLTGRIFLPSRAQRHDGAMRPDEWLNQSNEFFPFLQDDAKRAAILNKRYVVVLTVPAWQPEGDLDGLGDVAIVRKVAVQCGTFRLEGAVHVNLPAAQSRLLDWINEPDPFLLVRDPERWHLVQKRRITFLDETGE